MRSSVKTVGLAVLTLAVLVPANSHALWFLCDMKEAWDVAWKARESREALLRAADPIQTDLENFEQKREQADADLRDALDTTGDAIRNSPGTHAGPPGRLTTVRALLEMIKDAIGMAAVDHLQAVPYNNGTPSVLAGDFITPQSGEFVGSAAFESVAVELGEEHMSDLSLQVLDSADADAWTGGAEVGLVISGSFEDVIFEGFYVTSSNPESAAAKGMWFGGAELATAIAENPSAGLSVATAGLFSPELLDEIVDVNPALDLAPLRHSSARQLCVLEITEVREWSVDGTFDCAIIGSSTWDNGCWDGQLPTGAGGVFTRGASRRLRAVPGQWPRVEPALPIGRTRHGRSRHGCGGFDAWRKADTEVPESEFEGTGSIPMDSQVDDATARPTDPDARGCKTPAGWHTSFVLGPGVPDASSPWQVLDLACWWR